MPRHFSLGRSVGLISASTVLLTGILLLSAEAANTTLPPSADPSDDAVPSSQAVRAGENDPLIVDRLNTWAETKSKGKISPVKGGGKRK